MFRKTMVLVGMAAAAVALYVPAVAPADWSAGTSKIEVGVNVPWIGSINFSSDSGGLTCSTSHSAWTLEPGTTGTMNTLEPTSSSCKGTGGLAGCTVTSTIATGSPWTTHTNGTAVEITAMKIDYTLHGGFCPYHEVRLEGNLAATPNDAHAMTAITLSKGSGTPEIYNGTTGSTIAAIGVTGTLSIPPAGPYGIT